MEFIEETIVPEGERMAGGIRTFLFVDIRGYTRFTVEHGDTEALQLVEKFGALARKAFTAWHGQTVGSAGDELIAVFLSARDAIMSATQLQASFAEEAKTNPTFPQVGVGLDAGEAVPAGDTFIGSALNLAARLCKLAGPQEVLTSESVIHIAGKLEGLKYVERGFTQLKGFREPVHIFQIVDTRGVHALVQSESQELQRESTVAPLPIGAYLGALPSTNLVAREQELKRVLASADSVATGNGRLVLVSGEPGVGKTRLAQEVMLTVRNRQFLVAAGRCYEQQSSVPFYPFIDVLSSLFKSCPASIRAAAVGRWPYLYRLLPELSPESISAPGGSPEEMQRLFRAVEGFLQAVSTEVPVAIFLDDLHWADQPSIDLMQHLAQSSRATRLLLVGTYREGEIGPRHPLEAALRDLSREELVDTVRLRRLESDETSKLIAATLGDRSAAPELVSVIQGRAEGNPFFTQQLVKFLVERGDLRQADGRWTGSSVAGGAIPDSVRSVIEQRMARLGKGTQELLKEASVLGQTFRFRILEKLSGQEEVEIESCLEEASSRGLVVETQGDQYAFDHVLTQQALYADLPSHKKRRLHLAAAEAMEKLPGNEGPKLSAELAWHFLEADQEERAIPYALAAGDYAVSVVAYEEADRQYNVALDIARRLHNLPGEVSALTRRAKLCLDMFKGEDASHSYERLLDLAREGGNQNLELTARLGLARAYYIVALDETAGDSISRCREMSESAYDLASRLGDKRGMVWALLARRQFADFWPEYRDRWRDNAKEALALSREIGDSELLLATELATWAEGPRRESEERGNRLAKQLKGRNDLFRLNMLNFTMMWMQLDWGEYESSVKTCDEAIRLAKEIGVPPVQYPTLRAMAMLQLGEYGKAWESLQNEVVDPDHPFGQAMQTLGVAEYYWELQAFDKAAQACRELQQRAQSLRRDWMSRWAAGLLARSLSRRGKQDTAANDEITKELERFKGRVPHEVMAEVLLAEGKAEEALGEARAFVEEARHEDHTTDLLVGLELQARALLAQERQEEAVALTTEGYQVAKEHRNRSIGWRLLAIEGRALKLTGDEKGARESFNKAASIARIIGDSIHDPQARANFFGSPFVASTLEASE